MDKAVYVGAGCDIIPVILFPEIREFIFIDSQPKTECRNGLCYDANFVPRLEKLFAANNFMTITKSANYVEFGGDSQTVKYYLNTQFPEGLNAEIKKQLGECTNLIVCGHDPHKVILDLMPRLKTIICNTHTCYSPERDYSALEKEKSLCLALHQSKYNYKLMKENMPYEYWNPACIVPAIKNNYTICDLGSLAEVGAAAYAARVRADGSVAFVQRGIQR